MADMMIPFWSGSLVLLSEAYGMEGNHPELEASGPAIAIARTGESFTIVGYAVDGTLRASE